MKEGKTAQTFGASVARGAKASKKLREDYELDVALDLAMGHPNDLRDYQDCIEGARRAGAQGRAQ